MDNKLCSIIDDTSVRSDNVEDVVFDFDLFQSFCLLPSCLSFLVSGGGAQAGGALHLLCVG